ncbi:hypothetical protein Tco_0901955 [Tanacetum coccineum]
MVVAEDMGKNISNDFDRDLLCATDRKGFLTFCRTRTTGPGGLMIQSKAVDIYQILNYNIHLVIGRPQFSLLSPSRIPDFPPPSSSAAPLSTPQTVWNDRYKQKEVLSIDKITSHTTPNLRSRTTPKTQTTTPVLEESILDKSNKMEETDLTSPEMVVAEDMGQKHLHDFDETAMLLMTEKDVDFCNAATDGG